MSDLVQMWQQIIVGEGKSWVLFEAGTCVILMEPEPDLAQQAKGILSEWGPVHVGSPAGDFSVITLDKHPGWVVTSHHPNILNYVGPDEVDEGSSDVAIGLLGRSKRDRDAKQLSVVHVEDRQES